MQVRVSRPSPPGLHPLRKAAVGDLAVVHRAMGCCLCNNSQITLVGSIVCCTLVTPSRLTGGHTAADTRQDPGYRSDELSWTQPRPMFNAVAPNAQTIRSWAVNHDPLPTSDYPREGAGLFFRPCMQLAVKFGLEGRKGRKWRYSVPVSKRDTNKTTGVGAV